MRNLIRTWKECSDELRVKIYGNMDILMSGGVVEWYSSTLLRSLYIDFEISRSKGELTFNLDLENE